MRAGPSFSKSASAMAGSTFHRAIRLECTVIGMINGQPPAYVFEEPLYSLVLKAVQANEKRGDVAVMIALLRVISQSRPTWTERIYANNR